MNAEGMIRLMKTIADDMKNDAKTFDDQPFTGKTIAEYNGRQGAAIAALADTVGLIVKEFEKNVY